MRPVPCRSEEASRAKNRFRRYLNNFKKYYPRDKSFTDNFLGGNYKYNGLNTAVAFSKVHFKLDEYW